MAFTTSGQETEWALWLQPWSPLGEGTEARWWVDISTCVKYACAVHTNNVYELMTETAEKPTWWYLPILRCECRRIRPSVGWIYAHRKCTQTVTVATILSTNPLSVNSMLQTGLMQWWANLKSQSHCKISNLMFSNPNSRDPNPKP